MACCTSSSNVESTRKTANIDAKLRQDKIKERAEIKMLLLGAGEAGKSTIMKQMHLIHGSGYTPQERQGFKEVILTNAVGGLKSILQAMDTLNISLGDSDNVMARELLLQHSAESVVNIPPEIVEAMEQLWKDSGVQETFSRASEYQLNESTKYYLDNLTRITSVDYIPTDQDILRSRVRTTGIVETHFKIGDLTYKMFDVGGQRSERKKWIHCFENVTAIIFMTAISEYDQTLFEDETMNRMQESLTLFESICNSKWFPNTSIILFLNKIDLFREKLKRSPLSKYFPDYTGGDNYDAACDYILNKFTSLNADPSREIYAHFTCATDTSQMRFVMGAINDIIVRNNLKKAGLM